MKRITMSDEAWAIFYGGLVGLKMEPRSTGEAFYRTSPLVEEAVRAVQEAEDVDDPPVVKAPPTRTLEEAIAWRDDLRSKVEAYDVGDRPMSPPAKMLGDLIEAEAEVRRLRDEARKA